MLSQNHLIDEYHAVNRYGGVEDASPHKLVELLYTSVIDRIQQAAGAMARGDVAGKGLAIGKATSIIEELRRTLDMERGGEISETLHSLYEYIKERLVQANLNNDQEILQECKSLIETVLDGWRGIPQEIRDQFSPAMANG